MTLIPCQRELGALEANDELVHDAAAEAESGGILLAVEMGDLGELQDQIDAAADGLAQIQHITAAASTDGGGGRGGTGGSGGSGTDPVLSSGMWGSHSQSEDDGDSAAGGEEEQWGDVEALAKRSQQSDAWLREIAIASEAARKACAEATETAAVACEAVDRMHNERWHKLAMRSGVQVRLSVPLSVGMLVVDIYLVDDDSRGQPQSSA